MASPSPSTHSECYRHEEGGQASEAVRVKTREDLSGISPARGIKTYIFYNYNSL